MKPIEYKTPEALVLLSQKSKSDIKRLIKFLKKKKPGNLDDIVHQSHEELFTTFSCLDCANCCKTIGPRLTDRDINRLAKHYKMKPSAFIEQYVETDEDNDYVFKEHPCPFLLSDNCCMVYENRPKACRDYPHTDQKRFIRILNLSHKNCETCPVVNEVFERLKKEFSQNF